MEKLVLNFVGRDDGGNKLYKDNKETYFIKDDYNDIIYIGKNYDNDPYTSIKNIPKYKNLKIIIKGDENEPTKEEKFNYMMLGRLKSDCDYYLGYGNRCKNHLWAGNEQDQIKEMKKLYNNFSDDKKPQWLTWNQILSYEKEMIK